MALVQTFSLPHLPAYSIHISLFKDVTNATYLRQQLLDGNADFEYAFLDATTLLSTTHVLAAVFRAINDMLNSRLKTRNVHSEIVFSLSPNNNIAESFRRFGISPTTTKLLAIKIGTNDPTLGAPITVSSVQRHLSARVEGTPLKFSDSALASITDLAQIKKIYKLDGGGGGSKKGRGGKAQVNGLSNGSLNGTSGLDEREEMEAVILGVMALKGS